MKEVVLQAIDDLRALETEISWMNGESVSRAQTEVGAKARHIRLNLKQIDLGIERKFGFGDRVRKIKGSSWQGNVVGFYSTTLTPRGYCIESEREPGSVQIYPESALELVEESA